MGKLPWQHYFWDFDGTIMDTYPVTIQCCVALARSYGLEVQPERARALMLDTLNVCITTLAAEAGIPEEQFRTELWDRLLHVPATAYQPIPGIPALIRRLKASGADHYLVTNRDLSALDMLQTAGILDCFTDWVTVENGFPVKPDPSGVRYLLEKHQLDPEDCVMLGDRPLDVQAGYGAGMAGLLLDPFDLFPQEPCQLRASSPQEWVDYLLPDPEVNPCEAN